MMKYTLLAILLISSTVFAQDCTSKITQADCTALSGCEFTTTGSTCTNSCTALSQTDCGNATNSPNCTYVSTATCTNTADCTTLQASDCSNNSACTYTAASTAGTCAVKADLGTYCSGLSSTDCQGTGAAKCNYTAGTFSCTYVAGKCAALARADCEAANSFCTTTPTVCKAKGDCSTLDSTTCPGASAQGCHWDGTTCNDVCSGVSTSDADCLSAGGANGCTVDTSYSCADKPSTGTCAAAANASQCTTAATNTGFCKDSTPAGTCSSKDTYCTSKTDNTCDTTLCTFTPTTPFSCANAYDCTTLLANNQCGTKSGCTSTTVGCKNKAASSCNVSDNQATCTGNTKFCSFAQTGTCGVSATSYGSALSAAATAGSLIAALTFL